MPESQSVAGGGLLVLGVDTCGPSGTVALARIDGDEVAVLGEKELEGKTYSSTLVAAVGHLLGENGRAVADIAAIVVVSGPGSFTGVRVGLSAVKGLAEPARIPVIAVSRLAVLAAKAGVDSAALDAHRHEVFLRIAAGDASRELLAGAEELGEIEAAPSRVGICDEGAAALLGSAWPRSEIMRIEVPTAADAIRLCAPRVRTGQFEDLASLDGHYLRRSDAEIFGESSKAGGKKNTEIHVRRMTFADLEAVVDMAARTDHAPKWPRQAYEKLLNASSEPRRVALVAEAKAAGIAGFAIASLIGPEAEIESIVTALVHQRRGVARELFTALKNELRRAGVVDVILEVRDGNHAAREFYRFLGFREDGKRLEYYAEPTEDAVLMRVELR